MRSGRWQLGEELWYLEVMIALFVSGISSQELVNGSWQDIHKKVGRSSYIVL
jgi:hypothetical protein